MTSENANSFEYKSTLLGILPEGFQSQLDGQLNGSSWDTSGLKVVKKPSESSFNGPVDKELHPTLIGSAILQRKYGITNLKIDTTENPESVSTESKFDVNSTLAHFYTKCYESKTLPDFLCDRRIPLFLGTEQEIPFAVMARRLKLILKDGREKQVIEIKFVSDGHELADADLDGVSDGSSSTAFSKWAADGPGNEGAARDRASYAFIQGHLSRISNIGSWKQETKKYSIGMITKVDGVWKSERESGNYKGCHLAELVEVPQYIITPEKPCKALNSLYKRVWMKKSWMMTELAGEKNLLVGIKNEDSINEMWLYDVEKIPNAVQLASENQNFETWTPNQVREQLFKSLDLIYKTIESKKGTSEEFSPCYFAHFTPKDSDALIYDQDEKLTENFLNCQKQLIVRNLPSKFPPFFYRAASFNSESSSDATKSKSTADRELESEIPENFYVELDKHSVQTVLSLIEFPRELGFPLIHPFEMPDALNQYKNRHRDLELTFKDAETANIMFKLVEHIGHNLDKNQKAEKIPRGYENLVVERKEPRLADDHPLSRKSLNKSKKAATASSSSSGSKKDSQKSKSKSTQNSTKGSNSSSSSKSSIPVSVSVSVTPAPQQQSRLFVPRQKDRRSASFCGEIIHEHEN